MNTPSMIVGFSNILLQHHVGRFLASDQEKSQFFAHSQVTFGHQVALQRCRLATVEVVWHCIGIYQSDEHSQHDCTGLSNILLQHHVGRFHALDLDFLPTLR